MIDGILGMVFGGGFADRDRAMTMAVSMVCLALIFAGLFVLGLLLLLGVVH